MVFLHLRVQALIALARSFCLRLVYSLSACDAHDTAFGIIQGGAVGWLEDVSRTLLRVDLICRHDVSGGGNFSHQASIRGVGGVVLCGGGAKGLSRKACTLRPSIGTRPLFSVVPCPPCVCHSQHYILHATAAAAPTPPNHHLQEGAAHSAWGSSAMGSGQSPVVNILITTSALQNCCHHSRTHSSQAWPVPAAQCRSVV